MRQNFLAALLLTVFAVVPLSATALSAGGAGSSGSAVVSGTAVASPACLALSRNFGRGARGMDVARLQSYLAANASYSAGATGYFGLATRAAVMEWQAAHKVLATGYVGPMTRAALSCTGNGIGSTTTPITLTADPASGKAPLPVAFSASPKDSGQYIIEFGDGINSGALQSHCLSSNSGPDTSLTISCEISTTHIYQKAGTYTATLSPYVACLYTNTGPRCMIPTILLGQAQVTVY